MLSATQLQRYLRREIPLTLAMQLIVETANKSSVRLRAPLEENRNGHGTAFGGSIASLATLSCWSLIYNVLLDVQTDSQLVIGKATIDYLAPVDDDFTAEANLPTDFSTASIEKQLRRGRRSRITLISTVCVNSTHCATLSGDFAVLPAGSKHVDS